MDTQIFELYKSGLTAKRIAELKVNGIIKTKKPSERAKEFADYHAMLDAAEIIIKNSLDLFQKEFPREIKNYNGEKLSSFFKNLSEHPEMIIGCEDCFFRLVKLAVEPNLTSAKGTMFSWCWPEAYMILSQNHIRGFAMEKKSSDYQTMVYSLALHLDPTNDIDKERAICFFSSLSMFRKIYPDMISKMLEYLTMDSNLYRNDWVQKIVNFYEEKRGF